MWRNIYRIRGQECHPGSAGEKKCVEKFISEECVETCGKKESKDGGKKRRIFLFLWKQKWLRFWTHTEFDRTEWRLQWKMQRGNLMTIMNWDKKDHIHAINSNRVWTTCLLLALLWRKVWGGVYDTKAGIVRKRIWVVQRRVERSPGELRLLGTAAVCSSPTDLCC